MFVSGSCQIFDTRVNNLDVYVVYNLYEMGLFCMCYGFGWRKKHKNSIFLWLFPARVKKYNQNEEMLIDGAANAIERSGSI